MLRLTALLARTAPAPVVQSRGVPNILLRFTDGRSGVNRYQSVVAIEKKVAGMKVTVKQDRLFMRALTALDVMGNGRHRIVVAAQHWVEWREDKAHLG